jgi:hypothetical protein
MFGSEPYDVALFVLLGIGTAALAAVARRPIVILAPLVMSLPLGLAAATAGCPCEGSSGFEVLLVWVGVLGVGGALLAAITLVIALRRHAAEYHPPFRLDRAV